jgi:TrmH family RNA methyltransferase
MLSKSQIKLIKSLEYKKYRDETNLFVAEGNKVVGEFIKHKWKIHLLICTENWAKANSDISKNAIITGIENIQKISFLKNPPEVIGVFYQKRLNIDTNYGSKLGLALDEIQDSGNVGTILRVALWYGLDYVILGDGCANLYSTKVVQASAGAIAKINAWHENLEQFFSKLNKNIPIYGTFLEGTSIYLANLTDNGVIILGNEGKGIRENLKPFVNYKLFIPFFPNNEKPIDSLNVAVSAGIICSEFRRNAFLSSNNY